MRIEDEARRLLLERRQTLRGEPASSPSGSAARPGDRKADPGVPSDDRRREIEAIDEALSRIEEGSYGTCLACGGPLGLQRIRAIPEARYCLGCSGSVSGAAQGLARRPTPG